MNLASRIHEHLHPSEENGHQSVPFWVRHYDSLVRLVALGRVDKLHGGTLKLVGFGAGQTLLDIGCGTGELVLQAETQAAGKGTFVGLDVETDMIAQANRKAAEADSTATFAKASIDSIPFPDGSFDVITSSLMFHHLTAAQSADGLVEIHRILRPGGKLVVVDINTARRSLVSRFPGHRHLDHGDPVQDQVAEQLRQAGFTDISTGAHPMKALSFATGVKA